VTFLIVGLIVACAPANEPGDADVRPALAPGWSTDALGTLPAAGPTAGTGDDDAGAEDTGDDDAVVSLPDLAAIRRDGVVVRVRDGHVAVDAHPQDRSRVVGLDRRTLVEAVTGNDATGDDATEVLWTHAFTGETTGVASIRGSHMVPAVTDTTGRYVVLVSEAAEQVDGAIAPGRASSTIVIADGEIGERYRTTLDGNFQPEAFGDSLGPDGAPDTVYLLEYVPADAPTHYRVRVLRTSDGEVGLPVNLRDKASEVDATMAGLSRTQVVSGHDGGLLFTLYRGVAGEGDRHGYAFVHTLGLAGGVWCLDIAPAMELDALGGALVVAGDRLVVASANGTVGNYDIAAVLDPAREPVMDVVTQYLHPEGEPVLAATDDRLWVAWGNFVYELDPATLEMVASAPRQLARAVTAMAVSDGELLTANADGTIASTGGASIDVTPDNDDDVGADADIVALLVDDAVGSP
jgi:hypothetical protein